MLSLEPPKALTLPVFCIHALRAANAGGRCADIEVNALGPMRLARRT